MAVSCLALAWYHSLFTVLGPFLSGRFPRVRGLQIDELPLQISVPYSYCCTGTRTNISLRSYVQYVQNLHTLPIACVGFVSGRKIHRGKSIGGGRGACS